MQWSSSWLKISLVGVFLAVRFYLATLTYNPDIWNHEAWVESVESQSWSGLYERDMGERAPVNYPPVSLYSFYLGEKLYQSVVPTSAQSDNLRAFFYKLPSLVADMAIAYLLFRLLPFPRKGRTLAALLYLLNPALAYNSVVWGQIESLATLPALLTVFMLIRKRGDLALLFFTLGCLTKQNILPLAPLVLYGLYELRSSWRRTLFGLILSLGITLIAYAPLLPSGVNPLSYIPGNYLSAVGGQAHQHLASVNALNLYYGLGLNNIPDSLEVRPLGVISLRTLSLGIALCLALGMIWVLVRGGGTRSSRYLRALVLLALGTFMFTTRMHERHSYMSIAYLTLLAPAFNWRGWGTYLFLSALSFYNVYGVWAGYFWSPMGAVWGISMRLFSLGAAALSLLFIMNSHLFLKEKFDDSTASSRSVSRRRNHRTIAP